MTIQHIWIYPVKSLAGIEKDRLYAGIPGFLHDRSWMLVDKDFNFLTQREIPELSLFSIDIDENAVYVDRKGNKCTWEIGSIEKKVHVTRVWDDTAIVHKVSGHINQFFSDMLHQQVYLVKQSQNKPRQHFASTINRNISVSLADGYPYLLLGTGSISRLNQQLSIPVTYHRFRPNIVIETKKPHEEDEWEGLESKEVSFKNVKPCARCQIVNIDPNTAQKDKEPLKALSEYRKNENKVLFGINMLCNREGWVHKGDTLSSV